MSEKKKKPMKMMERKFAVPSMAMLLSVMNEAVSMGFSFKLMCLVCGVSLGYAVMETVKDIFYAKYGVIKKA